MTMCLLAMRWGRTVSSPSTLHLLRLAYPSTKLSSGVIVFTNVGSPSLTW